MAKRAGAGGAGPGSLSGVGVGVGVVGGRGRTAWAAWPERGGGGHGLGRVAGEVPEAGTGVLEGTRRGRGLGDPRPCSPGLPCLVGMVGNRGVGTRAHPFSLPPLSTITVPPPAAPRRWGRAVSGSVCVSAGRSRRLILPSH